MTKLTARDVVRRFLLPGAGLYGVLIGVGWLLGHPLVGLAHDEDVIDRDLAAHRTADLSAITRVFSVLADTEAVIAALVVIMVVLRLVYRRWDASLILLAAVLLQVTVFLLTTLVVDRHRPDVPHLDPAPPTSSFPSGHTGAATALYGGLAVLVAWRLRHTVLRVLLTAALVAMPVAVGMSRLYRGMHHPTDVAFGALNGLVCVVLAMRTFHPSPKRVPAVHERRRDRALP
jgi:membrane-associated phospholipid phosphatase